MRWMCQTSPVLFEPRGRVGTGSDWVKELNLGEPPNLCKHEKMVIKLMMMTIDLPRVPTSQLIKAPATRLWHHVSVGLRGFSMMIMMVIFDCILTAYWQLTDNSLIVYWQLTDNSLFAFARVGKLTTFTARRCELFSDSGKSHSSIFSSQASHAHQYSVLRQVTLINIHFSGSVLRQVTLINIHFSDKSSSSIFSSRTIHAITF